jgi:hypothetical protein
MWPFSPTSRKSAPHAFAKKRARLMLHLGSFELATTTLGKGSKRIGIGRKMCASGAVRESDSTSGGATSIAAFTGRKC